MRREFIVGTILILTAWCLASVMTPSLWWAGLVLLPLAGFGLYDLLQTKQTVRRNFPLIGNFRYLLEMIRPEINQYFIESNTDGRPFNRDQRSVVYQRSKKQLDTLPFGTRLNVYEIGYEWVNHSIAPVEVDVTSLRTNIGSAACAKPYTASILNVSAMSYGSLSKNAIRALNAGAKIGGFAHNTGEGGLSPYHLENEGDIIWQIGTGYFGCRSADGLFDPDRFREKSNLPQVRMIEVKVSQGAKPGHGGILPGAKVTEEIAAIRGVIPGRDVISPPGHKAFSTPIEMMHFLQHLRELSNGKPVGFKLCIGKRREFLAICKAMRETKIMPDFITVDGGEGGTGAAPLEFSNSVGTPLREGLIFVQNALIGFNLRNDIRILASGRVVTAFDLIATLALGADACNSARAMMLALGCIQALRCNSNACPTGVATQNPQLVDGLVVEDKKVRVASFHRETLKATAHLLGAMGVSKTTDLRPWHVLKRVGLTEIRNFSELYEFLEPGDLLNGKIPASYRRAMDAARPDRFHE